MMNSVNVPYKKMLLASMVTLLVACGSDNDEVVPPLPPSDNNPPIANPTSVTAIVGTAVMIDALANDSDPDGDALTLNKIELIEGSGEGEIKDNQLLFTPTQVGTAVFSYTIADPDGATDSATVTIEVSDSVETLSYVGSQTCLSCHSDKASFLETGHNFKLNKVIDGERPEYPFTTLDGGLEFLFGAENSIGTPTSYEDISYIIGGYTRRAMFVDKNGFILTGTGVMLDIPGEGETYGPESALGFGAGGGVDSREFSYCGRCHTTGWKDYTAVDGDNRNLHRQDDLPGMGGTFSQTGIQCESCHGAGSKHIQTSSKNDISRVAEGRNTSDFLQEDMAYGLAVACEECHTKDGERPYPSFKGKFNTHFGGDSLGGRSVAYEQGARFAADAILGMDADTGEITGKKADMACHTCHNPHQSKVNDDQPGHENAMVKQCIDCHGDKEFTEYLEMHSFVAKCESCHMPKDKHFFRINLDYAADSPENFSKDGKYVQPWNTSKDSCSSCHELDYDERAAWAKKMHK
ncbi:hypothetical protein TUM4438_04210 [Shewanella sairae]|uniref:Cytochrome c-552/4 domain-containing protein n=1 Tax=Shewanella sairae TaxID=190310 RepID=A0ABQ4P113_9GAMM|nr:Ig-like domain-containing protein [Shewanella sairae]MCL1128770.1 Ig-like domain-containing protein [Shewanella sairae]GIU41142.1 hypothetical protein TUM4438_04210 [Shewanella sairae]